MPSGYPSSAQLECVDCGAPKSQTCYPRCVPCGNATKRKWDACGELSCDRAATAGGLCKHHYELQRRASVPFLECSLQECDKDSRYGSKGMCAMHYQRSRRRGLPDDAALSRRPNGAGGTRQELRRSYESARRARKRGNFVENVDLATLWERDRGVCHICHLPAERWNWHMDHIIPISRGGEHSYANTAVAHPGCNLKKGDR